MNSSKSLIRTRRMQDAPILKLSVDILWTIINLNTNIYCTNDALRSTRRYSQVCRTWRLFILHCEPLWGKLMDLDSFHQYNTRWRGEVLRRSGASLLWIRGYIWEDVSPGSYDPLTVFFFSLLNDHWERIQKLDVRTKQITQQGSFRNWELICRPAPHLQVFRVDPNIPSKPWSPPLPMSLFANNAPSLHTFDVRLGLWFSFSEPWFINLRCVSLGSPLELPQILQALQGMRVLESLEIFDFSGPDILNDPGALSVRLPNLTSLSIRTTLPSILRTIPYLRVPSSCSFVMLPFTPFWGFKSFTNNSEFASLLLVLSEFTQNYIRFHQPSEIWVTASEYEFEFSDRPDSAKLFERKTPPPFFSLAVDSASVCDIPQKTYSFFRVMSSLDLKCVTRLHLGFEFTSLYSPDTFITFAASLSSIDTLYTNEATLECLLNWDFQGHFPNILFPLLAVLELRGPSRDGTHLLSFLELRKGNGRGLSVLDLAAYRSLDLLEGMKQRLREIPGLKITWWREY